MEAALLEMQSPVEVPVVGGMLWWNYDGLPTFGEVKVDEVPVLGPRSSYKVASRPGLLTAEQIGSVAIFLDGSLRPAA